VGIIDIMKKIQKQIKEFCKENNLESPIEHRVLDLVSETGEISKEVLKMSNYGRKKLIPNEKIRLEIGDTFYSLITIANYFNVDLEEALKIVTQKYKDRINKKGSAGSN